MLRSLAIAGLLALASPAYADDDEAIIRVERMHCVNDADAAGAHCFAAAARCSTTRQPQAIAACRAFKLQTAEDRIAPHGSSLQGRQ